MFARNGTEPALIGGLAVVAHRVVSDNTATRSEAAPNLGDAGAVLVREAGAPFQPPMGKEAGIDPIAEWLSLMEVV